jgi:hypothetical protein
MEPDERLFAFLDDLEGQAEALYDAERETDLADRSRAAYAEVTLAGRLMASVGREVLLDVLGVGPIAGTLRRVGPDWCLARGAAQDWVVRLAALVSVEGASARSVPEIAWPPTSRLGLSSALRRLADAGERCIVHSTDGGTREVVVHRVGHDFVEVVGGHGRSLLLARNTIAAVQSRG